jgi:ribonuclease G
MITLALDRTPAGLAAARLEDGRLEALAFEDDLVDAVFRGRVVRVDRGLQAAFVDIGEAEPAWLGAREARFARGEAASLTIDRLVHEGEAILVQVTREGQAGKGPRVTTDLAFPGLFLVHRPFDPAIGASRRLHGAARERALARGRELLGQGFTLRAASVRVDDAALLAEAAALRDRLEASRRPTTPPVRVDDEPPIARLLVRMLDAEPGRIVVPAAAFPAVRAFLAERLPALVDRLERAADAFETTGVADQIADALSPEVPLPGGGRLVIEPTTALVAIDVDGPDALAAGLEAAREIPRQLRLRELAGLVVIDFPAVPAATRARVMRELRRALARDAEPVRMVPMSPLGLVELGRRRRRRSLAERFGRPLGGCGDRGREPVGTWMSPS